ncbi:MAG: polymorphic toxin type 44 domain-containing protein, partial [Verrucomicrobia bacterium]|nr:polymorphic toxin type 44 domain-containing protein [Verrucomicrobiota bacterium]
MFKQNCDELRPHEEANIAKLRPGSVRVHGFASIEGPKGFNMALSCHRANRIAELIRAKRPDCRVEGTFKHGATPQPLAGAVPDANPPGFWRDVIVEQTEPASSAATANPRCGPDSTDWLISQIASAKKNVRVLEVQKQLATAAVSAPNISSSAKLDSTEIVEGAVAAKVIQQRQAAGNPRPTADANTQLSDAQIPLLEFQTAGMLAMSGDTDAIITLLVLRKASLLWKDLVGTRRPFDFKNDPATMGNPRTTNCPGSDCKSTLTLCPGEHESNCFGQDVPGNLFYAAIGAFVGFNENTLQLGSQWAQLASTKHWDPP